MAFPRSGDSVTVSTLLKLLTLCQRSDRRYISALKVAAPPETDLARDFRASPNSRFPAETLNTETITAETARPSQAHLPEPTSKNTRIVTYFLGCQHLLPTNGATLMEH